MREIKFRAWDTKAGKMSLPFNIKEDWGDYLIDFGDYNADGASKDMEWLQYTGLKDKRGVEIYEGDILERRTQRDDAIEFTRREVKWIDDYAQYTVSSTRTEEFAIIGNIYENPGLLKV